MFRGASLRHQVRVERFQLPLKALIHILPLQRLDCLCCTPSGLSVPDTLCFSYLLFVSRGSLTEYVYVVQRLYLEPSTTIGPSPDEVLRPLVLSFDLPQHLPPRSPSEDERLATATERA